MVVLLSGEIYTIEGDIQMSRLELLNFFLDGHREDIIIQYKNGMAVKYITYHNILFPGKNHPDYIHYDSNSFQTASQFLEEGMIIPVKNDKGEFISILGYKKTFYNHTYKEEGPIDYRLVNLYDCICLNGLNEFTYEIFKACCKGWKGRIILIGNGWDEYESFVVKEDGIEVILVSDNMDNEISNYCNSRKVLQVKDFLAVSTTRENTKKRFDSGIFSCDEIMNTMFGMAIKKNYGEINPNKSFYVIRTKFKLEGLFAIKYKCLQMADFAAAMGYIPIIDLSSSNDSFYSDDEGENIWDKFFVQPSGYQLEEVYRSKNVTLSPVTYILSMDLYIMQIISNANTIIDRRITFSNKMMEYIKDHTAGLLTNSSKTLGVLIRGTDYIVNKPTHESIQSDVHTVINKINEVNGKWNEYEAIYLATEDEDIWRVMKEEFGDRLISVDQVRYTVNHGEYLFQKKNERNNDGWLRGAEYICVIWLLAQCESLIASGNCGGVGEAISINDGKYKNVYIYDNGVYE
jgi:hypothetical protein